MGVDRVGVGSRSGRGKETKEVESFHEKAYSNLFTTFQGLKCYTKLDGESSFRDQAKDDERWYTPGKRRLKK